MFGRSLVCCSSATDNIQTQAGDHLPACEFVLLFFVVVCFVVLFVLRSFVRFRLSLLTRSCDDDDEDDDSTSASTAVVFRRLHFRVHCCSCFPPSHNAKHIEHNGNRDDDTECDHAEGVHGHRDRVLRVQHQQHPLPARHLPARDLPAREEVRPGHARHLRLRVARVPVAGARAAVLVVDGGRGAAARAGD